MATKKVLKVQCGDVYIKEMNKSFPVYKSYWQNEDGSYSRNEKVFVNEVELPDKKESKPKVEA